MARRTKKNRSLAAKKGWRTRRSRSKSRGLSRVHGKTGPLIRSKKGRPHVDLGGEKLATIIALNHDDQWWVAIHVQRPKHGSADRSLGVYSANNSHAIFTKDAKSKAEAEKIYRKTNSYSDAQGWDLAY